MWIGVFSHLYEVRIYGDMGDDKDKKDEKLVKRAAALRENLKKRKVVAQNKKAAIKDKDK